MKKDYLDCIYLHHPTGDFVGAWKDLEKAYRQGKVRALGISNGLRLAEDDQYSAISTESQVSG